MTSDEILAFIKKNPISVGCTVLSIALGAGIYFRGSMLPAAEAELAQRTAEADRYTTNVTNATDLKDHLDKLTAANKEIDSRIIRVQPVSVNYQYFYKIIAESGVKQIDLRWSPPGAVPKGRTYLPVGFNVAVQGTLEQVLHFLRLLESGARYARIMTANCVVPSNDRGGLVTLSLTLELLGVP